MRIQDNNAQTNVRFYIHTTPNEAKSKAAGRPIFDEMEVCEITHPGNKQTVGVFPAHEEYGFRDTETEFGPVREKITYAMQYNDQYLKFKSGDAQSLGGTPLEELTFLTAGKRLELKALKIYTAEALAGLDGNALKMLGQGGRDLKNKAQAYLETAEKTATVAGVKEALADRDAQIADMQAKIDALSAGKPVKAVKAKASEFDTFENADIINWIEGSKPDHGFDENTPREELIAAADAILAVEGKKKAA